MQSHRQSPIARLLLLAATLPMIAAAQQQPAPCSSAEYRQFDFWLGEWDVHGPAGKLAGTNRISVEYGGCVLHERYETGRGYRGESLNAYDAGRKLWHQTWVDSTGMLLLLEGGLRGKQMVLEGDVRSPANTVTRHRITWTPNDDGTVRQLWETRNQDSQWTTAFDGRYSRRRSGS